MRPVMSALNDTLRRALELGGSAFANVKIAHCSLESKSLEVACCDSFNASECRETSSTVRSRALRTILDVPLLTCNLRFVRICYRTRTYRECVLYVDNTLELKIIEVGENLEVVVDRADISGKTIVFKLLRLFGHCNGLLWS